MVMDRYVFVILPPNLDKA